MRQARKYLALTIIALSFPAAAFDGGRGIHIALTGNSNAPYAVITETSQVAEKVAVAVADPKDVPVAKTSTMVAEAELDY